MAATAKYTVNNQGAHRFTMWLFIVTTSMVFAGFTSAFLVRKGAGGAWTSFSIPDVFQLSTLLILLSSVFLQVAHVANKKQHRLLTSVSLFLTFSLGLLFCFFQVQGWKELTDIGVYLSYNPNPAGPFFYVITFIHALHVGVGILFLASAFIYSLILLRRPKSNEVLTNIERSEKGMLKIRTDLLTLFWHFMGILWVYLYLFLTLNLK
jgi:cytochrome c oxidase subunit III